MKLQAWRRANAPAPDDAPTLADREDCIEEYVDGLRAIAPDAVLAVLDYVDEHPGTTPGRVATAVDLHPSTVSHHLGTLRRGGLLLDVEDPEDRRRQRLYPAYRARD